MPANSNAKFVKPWSEKVLAESNGEIKVEIYPSMQLGGKPPQLVDQVRDGVVDIVWTGLEDNIRLDKDNLAPSNASLVKIAKEICERYNRPVASWNKAREILELV
ncbi:3-keto-5-aminohexanoate cleavage protein [Paracoccaceae bacterium]|nr:3-keto-5-aminohexanoate cleavage protein [Paracoccaceae bacterium]